MTTGPYENRWKNPRVPKRGWTCIDVIDVIDEDDPVDEREYEICRMCGYKEIRYVHTMEHPDYHGDEFSGADIDAGCECAEKMSGDYVGPRRRESKLKQRSAGRKVWLNRRWRTSRNGNPFLRADGHYMVIFTVVLGRRWGCSYDGVFSQRQFASMDAAKLALFDRHWEITREADK